MLRREGKSLPLLFSDDEAEAFIGSADLSNYNLTVLKPIQPRGAEVADRAVDAARYHVDDEPG